MSTHQSFDSKIYRYDSTEGGLVEADLGTVMYPTGYTFPMPARQDMTQYNSYVRRINFSAGHVLFNMNSEMDKGLESIEIYDLSGGLVRRIIFNQTYMRDFFSLRLESVRIESPDGGEAETYSFTYNGAPPPRDTRSVDRWGYYNAKDNPHWCPR